MMLSIIVPVYNMTKLLPRCVDSILRQTFDDFELLLIDDGSTDGSSRLCDEYAMKDKRVRVIHKINDGALMARVTGTEHALGEYLCFVDSDDWIEPNYVKTLISPLLNDSSIDISIGVYDVCYSYGKVVRPFKFSSYKMMTSKSGLQFMLKGKIFDWAFHGKIYKKVLFSPSIDFVTKISYGEDTECNWYLFCRAKKICYIPKVLYHYYMHSNSMIHQEFSVEKIAYLKRYELLISQSNDYEIKKSIAELFLGHSKIYLIEMIEKDLQDCRTEFFYYRELLVKLLPLLNRPLTDAENRKIKVIFADMEVIKKQLIVREENLINQCNALRSSCEFLYIYGTGDIGKKMAKLMTDNFIPYEGFVVSYENFGEIYNSVVKKFWNAWNEHGNSMSVILAMSLESTQEVIKKYINKTNIKIMNAGQYFLQY